MYIKGYDINDLTLFQLFLIIVLVGLLIMFVLLPIFGLVSWFGLYILQRFGFIDSYNFMDVVVITLFFISFSYVKKGISVVFRGKED